ncbi:hypothetical protein sos41_42920 [Alphaproteobacteria bacterium SO-S41]|nr:hypothetical protein sos41_42920 [Alphaproteobacteria bacterium SO-S41]
MRILSALTAALLLLPSAFALSAEEADKAVAAFIAADGYTAVPDDAHVTGDTGYTKRFVRKEGTR